MVATKVQDCLVSNCLVTEGECDAMAVYEMFDKKWASVSVKRGAQGAVRDIRDSIEFVESFDHVVLCFDNDKYGREAARKVARIIKPGKAKIVSLPQGFKDANAMLEQGQYAQFTKAWWDAKTYTPSGIMELSSVKDKWLHREQKESIAYPWEGLNKKLYGMRILMNNCKSYLIRSFRKTKYLFMHILELQI